MASFAVSENFGERRVQWQRLERYWRDSLEEAAKRYDGFGLAIHDAEGLLNALEAYSTTVDRNGQTEVIAASEAIALVADRTQSFADIVASASRYRPAATLVWTGIMAVMQARLAYFSTAVDCSGFLASWVTALFTALMDSIPILEHDSRSLSGFSAVQYAYQDLFEDYMGYCTQLCSFLSRIPHDATKPSTSRVYSRSPHGMLDATKTRVSRHVSRLRDAVRYEAQTQRSQQDSQIAGLVPSGISDMPHITNDGNSGTAVVEFPVTTIDRARNGAFVGQEELLDDIAKHASTFGRQTTQQNSRRKPDLGDATTTPARVPSQGESSASPTSPGTIANGDRTSAASSPTPIVVVNGLAGIGKTQTVLEYYYEHRGQYDATFWVNADQDWTLSSSFARIADRLQLLGKRVTDDGGHELQSKAMEHARLWLQRTAHRWLLIFDNVEDLQDLAQYLPAENRSQSAVIITTQLSSVPAWIGKVHITQVEPLNAETAAMCLFRYLDREAESEEEHDIACELSEHVGCLPLAMATIGGYVKQSQVSLAEVFENIKHTATLWEKAHKVKDTLPYPKALISVFNQAFRDLTVPARELLNVIAFLDPDSIPEAIFTAAIDKGNIFQTIKSLGGLHACYFELRSRLLIRRDTSNVEKFISVHRAIQWNVLLDLSTDYNKRWDCFQQAFKMVQLMLPQVNPNVVPEADVWPPYAKHGRQILELRSHCLWPDPPVSLPVPFAKSLADMGTYMWFSGKFPEGEKALGTAYDICEDNNMRWSDGLRAHIYQTCQPATAKHGFPAQRFELRAQDIGRKHETERTRDEDIQVWAMHSDLAFGFIQEENFDSTAEYMEECVEQYKKWDEEEMRIPYEYAKYYQLMSHCYMSEQKPVEAIKAIARCHELMQEAAGPHHPMAQLIKFCHANLLWHSGGEGARQKALDINLSVLEFRWQLLGEFSHFTLESYSTCGKLCHEAGQVQKARELLEVCLQRRKRAVWNEEGITRAQYRWIQVMRTLAEHARREGDQDRAEDLSAAAAEREEEVMKIIERYRRDYADFMPSSEDPEQNLDQMVSIWAGRFTGGLRQLDMDLSFLQTSDTKSGGVKRRRLG